MVLILLSSFAAVFSWPIAKLIFFIEKKNDLFIIILYLLLRWNRENVVINWHFVWFLLCPFYKMPNLMSFQFRIQVHRATMTTTTMTETETEFSSSIFQIIKWYCDAWDWQMTRKIGWFIWVNRMRAEAN